MSVQFTNTTVNSEAGQGREQALGGVKERLLNQETIGMRWIKNKIKNGFHSMFRSPPELTCVLFT